MHLIPISSHLLQKKGKRTMIETTSLFTVPAWYLTWCWDNEAIQTHWKQEWLEEDGRLQSNIYPGDRFSVGRTPDIGVVYDKIVWTYKEKNRHRYEIGGKIGTHLYDPTHEAISDGRFLWIPTIEQLLALKQHMVATDLFFYLANRADPEPLVESYLDAAELAGLADQNKNWLDKRIYGREHAKLHRELERYGISIDEARDPEAVMAKEGTEEFHFFHVRIDDEPWKKVDSRNGEWSVWNG
jgi:hypothetical protein